jgi:4'-phosphopantetheinyl transferase
MTEVVMARLDAGPEEVRSLRARLSDAERQRAGRFRYERDRRRFIVARARLRELLAARLDVKPQAIELAYGKNGKPGLAQRYADSGWRFNVAHCDDVAVYAFSRDSDVGIDIEAIRAIPEADDIAARFFSRREYAAYSALAPRDRPLGFLQCWTRKEALAKALGDGLSMPLDEFDVSRASGWRLQSFSPLPGFVAALACHHG